MSQVQTDPRHEDPRLRGRTYAIPFDRVWTAAVSLAGGGLKRWRLVAADDEAGKMHAETQTLVFRVVDDVYIRIGLDSNGQTRVDLIARARNGRADLGRNARRTRSFLRALDAALSARPEQILDATRELNWSA